MIFKIKTYKEVERKKLIEFMNVNDLADSELDESLFEDCIEKRIVFSDNQFIVVVRKSKIVGIALIEDDPVNSFQDYRTGIISLFFIRPIRGRRKLRPYALSYLLRLAKRKGYSRLLIARGYSGILKSLNSESHSEQIQYFLRQGFGNRHEMYNVLLEREHFSTGVARRNIEHRRVTVRNCEERDRENLMAFTDTEFPWWSLVVKRFFATASPDYTIGLAEHDGRIIGFRSYFTGIEKELFLFKIRGIVPRAFSGDYRSAGCLYALGVAKEWRRIGLGSLLTHTAIERLFAKGARCIAVSTVTPDFFARFGFKPLDKYTVLTATMT